MTERPLTAAELAEAAAFYLGRSFARELEKSGPAAAAKRLRDMEEICARARADHPTVAAADQEARQ